MRKLTVGSLFSGIGGFDLGLERTGGFEVRFQVEIDEYCRRVLAKHWPDVKRYGDIREVSDVERVDVLCGGFPCQDISDAGSRAGIKGNRSGLWSEYARLIRILRPRYAIVENVAALSYRGMESVLGDLAGIGYDAEWHVLPACAFGASHPRERVFVVAYPKNDAGIYKPNRLQTTQRLPNHAATWQAGPWDEANANICRMDDGIPDRVDRTSALGNAVVPQIVTWLGNQILEYERKIERPCLDMEK